MNKSKEDKLRELKIPEDKWELFSGASIDVMYDQFRHIYSIHNTKNDRLLYFLNEILTDSKLELIDNIDDFQIDRVVLVNIDGEEFVKKHKTKLEEYGIHLNNDLYYSQRTRHKSYILTVLKGICKYYGYEFQSKVRTKYINNERTDTRYYKLFKPVDNQDKKL